MLFQLLSAEATLSNQLAEVDGTEKKAFGQQKLLVLTTDEWETRHGTDPRNPVDSTKFTKSGYTWLERYCHACADRLIQPAAQ